MEVLRVPCHTTGEVMELPSNELPDDPINELLPILRNVKSPLDAWVNIAIAYYRQGKFQQFEAMFRAMVAPETQKEPNYRSAESVAAHVRMRVAAASYELIYGSGTTDDSRDLGELQTKAAALKDRKALIDARLKAAERHINAGSSGAATLQNTPLSGIAQTLVLSMRAAKEVFVAANSPPSDGADAAVLRQHSAAISELVREAIAGANANDASLRKFSEAGGSLTLESQQQRAPAGAAGASSSSTVAFIPSLLLQASDAYEKGNYVLARSLYAQVVSSAPDVSPAPVRTALGLSLHQLGHIEAARTAFARALQLQPDYPPALTFLATLENARLTSAAAASASGGTTAAVVNLNEKEKDTAPPQPMVPPVEAAAADIGARGKVEQLLKKANAASNASAVADAKDGPAASSAAVQAGGLHLPAHTLLEIAHSTFERFAPLKASASAGSENSGSAQTATVTATLTNGSRLIVFSSDVRKALSNSQTLRFLIRKPGVNGAAPKPLAVPMKLILDANPVIAMPFSSLPDQIVAAHPATLQSKKDELTAAGEGELQREVLFVGRSRTPWPYASMAGVPVTCVDLEGSLSYAKQALAAAKTPEVKAEAHYAMARAHHAKCIFMDASIEYRNCHKLNPQFAPALFGLAQIALIGRQMDKVDELLSKLLALKTDDRSALRLLAYIRGSRAQPDNNAAFSEALETARKAYDSSPADPTTAAMYGLLLARQDTPASIARAYKVFESIVDRSDKAGVSVPSAVFNNCGVLAMRQAAHESNLTQRRQLLALAERQLLKAVENVAAFELFPGASQETRSTAESKLQALFSPGGITIAFNLARLDEVQGKPQAAEATYVKITQTAPNYFDAHLRLGLIAFDRGEILRAAEAFKNTAEAAMASASSAEPVMQQQAFSAAATAFCLLGRAREAAGDSAGAREAFKAAENVPAKGVPGVFGGFIAGGGGDSSKGSTYQSYDPYPSIALANLAFKDVYSAADERSREPILRACFDAYKNALKRWPQNLYAANGLGMILAEQGKLDAANDVFAKVREASPDALPATMNLAHTQVALGNVGPALQLYSHASKKLLGNGNGNSAQVLAPAVISAAGGGSLVDEGLAAEQVKLLSYEARAHMESGSFGSAVKALTKAVHLAPNDLRARFNLAFAMAEEALRVLKLDPTARTAAEVEEAVEHMKASAKGFDYLLATLDALHSDLAQAESNGDKDAVTRLNARIASVGKTREVVKPLVAHVSGTIPAALQHLADARRRAVQSAAENERRAALAAQRQREKEEHERTAKEAEENKKRAAREAAKRLQELLTETQARAAERAAEDKDKEDRKDGGAGKKPKAGNSSNSSSDDSEEEVGAKRKKPMGGKTKKKARPAKRQKTGDSDDEGAGASSSSSSSDSDSSSSSSDSESGSGSSSSSSSGSDSDSSSSSSDSDSSSSSSGSGSDSDSDSSDESEGEGEAGGSKKSKQKESEPADALEAVFGKAEEAAPDMEALFGEGDD